MDVLGRAKQCRERQVTFEQAPHVVGAGIVDGDHDGHVRWLAQIAVCAAPRRTPRPGAVVSLDGTIVHRMAPVPMTVTEKILARAAGRASVSPGEYLEIAPTSTTVLAAHNGRAKGMPEMIANGWKPFDPERVMIVDGHLGASASHRAAEGRELTRQWMAAMGVPNRNFVRLGRGGIENMVAVERCWALPGDVYVQGANGHISTAGGARCLRLRSFVRDAGVPRARQDMGQGPADACGSTPSGRRPPASTHATCPSRCCARSARPAPPVRSSNGAASTSTGLSMDGRLAICSQALFSAGWTAIVNPDDTTIDYVRRRTSAAFEPLVSDPDAAYWKTVTIDVSALEPIVVVPPKRWDIQDIDCGRRPAGDQGVHRQRCRRMARRPPPRRRRARRTDAARRRRPQHHAGNGGGAQGRPPRGPARDLPRRRMRRADAQRGDGVRVQHAARVRRRVHRHRADELPRADGQRVGGDLPRQRRRRRRVLRRGQDRRPPPVPRSGAPVR